MGVLGGLRLLVVGHAGSIAAADGRWIRRREQVAAINFTRWRRMSRLTVLGRAAIRRFADFGRSWCSRDDRRECLVAWLRRQIGEVPEWLKGTDCKSVGYAYVGSNPTLSTTAGPEAPLIANRSIARSIRGLAFRRRSCAELKVLKRSLRKQGDTLRFRECGYSSVVEQQPSKLNMRVRFPLPAPDLAGRTAPVTKPLTFADRAPYMSALHNWHGLDPAATGSGRRRLRFPAVVANRRAFKTGPRSGRQGKRRWQKVNLSVRSRM